MLKDAVIYQMFTRFPENPKCRVTKKEKRFHDLFTQRLVDLLELSSIRATPRNDSVKPRRNEFSPRTAITIEGNETISFFRIDLQKV